MTIGTAEARLKKANQKHEFMCGTWSITQKVKTNDVTRTEELSHKIFSEYHDSESVSVNFFPEEGGCNILEMGKCCFPHHCSQSR